MRNPLFTDNAGTDHVKAQWQEAAGYLRNLQNIEVLRELFCDFWRFLFRAEDVHADVHTTVAPARLESYINRFSDLFTNQSIAFVDSVKAIISQKELWTYQCIESNAARLLAVDSLVAALVSEPPGRRSLDLAYGFLHSDFFLFEKFEDDLISSIHLAQQVKTWIRFLSESIVKDWMLPEEKNQSAHQQDFIEGELERWKRCADPYFARHRRYENNYVRGLDTDHISRLLLRLDVEAWLLAIDKLPLPHHIWGAARTPQIREDGDMIRLLISKAPLVFNAKDAWTRSVVAVVLAELVYDHAKAWHEELFRLARIGFMQYSPAEAENRKLEAEENLQNLKNGGLQHWMFQAYQTLAQRADGQSLAWRLLAQRARVAIVGDWGEKEGEWRLSKCALDSLAAACGSADLSASLLRTKWNAFARLYPSRFEDEEDGIYKEMCRESLPIFVGAIGVFEAQIEQSKLSDTERQDEVTELWSWFAELLHNQDLDAADIGIKKGFTYALHSTARLLWHLPSPIQSWEIAYKGLAMQRRSIANNQDFHGSHSFEPSDFLISVGIVFVQHFTDAGHSGCAVNDVRLFVWELMRNAFYLYLTEVGSGSRRVSLQCSIADCLCLMLKVYPNEYELALEFSLSFLSKDDSLIDLVYRALLQRGCSASLLQQLFASASLDRATSAAKLQSWKALLPS